MPWRALSAPRLSNDVRRKFAKAACEDFKVFCRLCGPPEWSFGERRSVHDMIADAAVSTKRAPDGKIRIHIEAPRTAGKSALAGHRHAAWRLARSAANWHDEPYKNGSISMAYMCEHKEMAEKAGTYVKNILSGENNVTKVFGKLVDPKAAIGEFTLLARKTPRPDPSWFTGTAMKSTTGTHPDLIYVDDVETPKSCRTLDSMMKTRAWYIELQAQLNPRGEIRVMGTRYDENDLYGFILGQDPSLWTVMIATVENSFCPTLTPEHLAGLKASGMSPAEFAARYMNNPWPSELQEFTADMFKTCKYDDRVKGLPKYLLVDVAGSQSKDACETAMWVVAKDSQDNAYCIDLVHGRWPADEVIERMATMFIKYELRWYVVEQRVLTTWVKPFVEKIAEEYKLSMPVRLASGKNYVSKDHHIEALVPRFKKGKIYFCDSIPRSEINVRTLGGKIVVDGPVVNAFTRWPKAKLKDVPDALAYVDEYDNKDAPLVPKARSDELKTWTEKKTMNPWREGGFSARRNWKYGR